MNFTDERYVRLYTRDTETWLLMSWTARALLCFMLRKVDRSGVIDTKTGARGLAVIVGMPLKHVDPAVAELVREECVQMNERGYVIPRFVEAQEAIQSDRVRAKEFRERRRAKALGIVTERGEPVTPRDERVGFRDESSLQLSYADPSVPALAEPRKKQKKQQRKKLAAAGAVALSFPRAPDGWMPPAGGAADKEARRRIGSGEITAADAQSCAEDFHASTTAADVNGERHRDNKLASFLRVQGRGERATRRQEIPSDDAAYLEELPPCAR